MKHINKGWPKKRSGKLKESQKVKDSLAEKNSIILKNKQILIPTILRHEFLKPLHIGHIGIVRMIFPARSNVYCPGMNK